MTSPLERFYSAIENAETVKHLDLIGLFVYYLTEEAGAQAATVVAISGCYQELHLKPPTRIAAYLSEGLTSKPPRYVKVSAGGYALQRHYRDKLSAGFGARTAVVQTSKELRDLEAHLAPGGARDFLAETIDCFEAGANRATITMCWVLAVDHLFQYILKHKLAEFNAALVAHPDKRLRKAPIAARDDFSDLPEKAFLELSKSADVISNDVRKILQSALDTRNTAAHPSGVVVKRTKVIALVEDLVTNVVLKYKI